MKRLIKILSAAGVIALTACGPQSTSMDAALSGIGVSLPFPHDGNLAKRNYTWTIARDYLPNVQEDYVRENLQTAVAVWSTTANLKFKYVENGPADITYAWKVNSATEPSLYPDAQAYADTIYDLNQDATGAKLIFNRASLKRQDSPVGAWKAGDRVDNWWHHRDTLLTTAIHEFGHFLGLHHSGFDANYKPDPEWNQSVMDQGYKSVNTPILSVYDYNVITKKYGTAKIVPFIEIRRSNGKYFYTSSWPEANYLITSDPGNVFTVLVGALHKDPGPGRRPLYRHYVPALDGHSYTLDNPIVEEGTIQEGITGYVDAKQGKNTAPMRLVEFGPGLEQLFTTKLKNPEGTVDAAGPIWGFITPIEKIGNF